MTEEVLPDWVKKKKRQLEEANTQRNAEQVEYNRSRKLIELGGPEFWKDFARELAFNIEACKELGIEASLSGTGTDSRPGFEASFNSKSNFPRLAHFGVFYQLRTDSIEVFPKDEGPYRIQLQVDANGTLQAALYSEVLSARELAERLTQRAAERVI